MRGILTILILCVSSVLYANDLKTYDGVYEDFLKVDALHPNGRAIYSYFENEDGSRNYHGNFKLTHTKYSLVGRFDNNVQEGKWIYKEKTLYGTLIVSIEFVNGIPSGSFSVKLVKNSNGQQIGYLIATLNNGVFIGDISILPHSVFYYSSFEPYMNKIDGSFDSNGNPTGKWFLKSKTRQLTENYIGNSIELKYVNTTTGDAIKENRLRIPYLPNIAVKIANNIIPKLIFRSTPKFKMERFELFQVPDDFEGSLNYFDGDGEYSTWRFNSYRK